MRVLITGASGCIGAWVARALLNRGIDVLAFDLDPEPARLRLILPDSGVARVRFIAGSIEDTATLKTLVRDGGVTHIVHLAAVLMPYCQQNPAAGAAVNVVGTLNVFEAARDAGRPVPVVYASSAAVWGPGEDYGDRALNEDDPIKPSTFYGVFKHSNEACARIFHSTSGVSSIGLRPWTVYGAGRDRGLTSDPTFAIKAAALRLPFRIRLSGSMDMQYVEDVAEAFVHCLLSGVDGAHVFNLAGEVVTMEELIGAIARLRPEAARLLSFSGPQVPVAFRMDASRLDALVPGIPRTPLEEGIRRTLEIFDRLKSENRLDPYLPS